MTYPRGLIKVGSCKGHWPEEVCWRDTPNDIAIVEDTGNLLHVYRLPIWQHTCLEDLRLQLWRHHLQINSWYLDHFCDRFIANHYDADASRIDAVRQALIHGVFNASLDEGVVDAGLKLIEPRRDLLGEGLRWMVDSDSWDMRKEQ